MKRLLTFTLCLLALTACDKTPENGKLDGMWHLVELTQTGQPAQNVAAKSIYWNFQLDLMIIHNVGTPLNGQTNDTAARFEHKGGRLLLTSLYIHNFDSDDIISDPASELLLWTGIRGDRADFAVETLTNKRMVLQSEEFRLVFRKF